MRKGSGATALLLVGRHARPLATVRQLEMGIPSQKHTPVAPRHGRPLSRPCHCWAPTHLLLPLPPFFCRLVLPNRRQDLQVAYVSGASTLVSSSPVIVNAAPNLPSGVKVVPQVDPSQMSVQWQTLNASQPQVVWGTSAAALTASTSASTTTYTKADIVSACSQGLLTSPLSTMTSVFKGWTDPGALI